MSFPIFVCIYVSNTPHVNSTMVYEKVLSRLFGIEKFRGKCFLEHFIANFHIFPYNALQTCHLQFMYISVSNRNPLVSKKRSTLQTSRESVSKEFIWINHIWIYEGVYICLLHKCGDDTRMFIWENVKIWYKVL